MPSDRDFWRLLYAPAHDLPEHTLAENPSPPSVHMREVMTVSRVLAVKARQTKEASKA